MRNDSYERLKLRDLPIFIGACFIIVFVGLFVIILTIAGWVDRGIAALTRRQWQRPAKRKTND